MHEQQVKKIIAEILNVAITEVTDELSVGDIDEWDSVNNVRILQALEQKFGFEADIMDALDAEDVEDYVKLVKKNVADWND